MARSKTGRARHRILADALVGIGVVLLVVAGYTWFRDQLRYREQDEQTQRLEAYVSDSDDGSSQGSDSEAEAPQVDWAGLKAVNDEVVGWLQIPGTVVNYPVYQASDNEYYLHHSAEGSETVGGQVFLDCDNTGPGLVDYQSVLYGHHLRNGAMFQPISRMDDQEVFDATPTVWYVTENEATELEPLLLYYTTPDDQAVRTFDFASDEEFRQYLTDRLARAKAKRADAEALIGGAHHVLTLSTCNYYDGYGRTELVCIPKSEAVGSGDGVTS